MARFQAPFFRDRPGPHEMPSPPLLTGAQNWRKLSVSPISLTLSGSSSYKIMSYYVVLCVGNGLLKGTLKRLARRNESLNTMFGLIGSKYGVCPTSFQSFEKFGAR